MIPDASPLQPDPLEALPVPVPELVDLAHALLPDEWEALNTIRRVLSAAGHRIVLVGGAVRNLVLGHKPNDLDLASDARPDEIQKLFRHVIPTGIQHGTVTIRMHKMGFEITTFRVDGAYTDSRRPDSVHFTEDLLEDLKRRDFTVNAMALDLEHRTLIDPHRGRVALKERLIQTVGNPRERFGEDALRIVRGIRFACQLEFDIHAETFRAMKDLGPSLAGVSVERFLVELKKTLASRQARRGLELMKDCGILGVFIPELDILEASLWQRTLRGLEGLLQGQPGDADARIDLGLGSLFRFVPPGTALQGCLRRLKLSRREMDLMEASQRFCTEPWPDTWSDTDWRRYLSRCKPGCEAHHILLCAAFKGADLDTAGGAGAAAETARGLKDVAPPLMANLKRVMAQNAPRSIGDLAIGGEDLVLLGIPKSPLMGTILGALLDEVLVNPEMNTPGLLREQVLVMKDRLQPQP